MLDNVTNRRLFTIEVKPRYREIDDDALQIEHRACNKKVLTYRYDNKLTDTSLLFLLTFYNTWLILLRNC